MIAQANSTGDKEVKKTAEQLSTTLKTIEDPNTHAAVRTELTKIVDPVVVTLKVMEDPKTSPELRSALMKVVEPTTITLKIIQSRKAPPQRRSTAEECARQLIIVLKVVRNPKTSPEHRDVIDGIMDPITISLKIIEDRKIPSNYQNAIEGALHPENEALKIAADPRIPLLYQNGALHAVAPLTAPLKEMKNAKATEQRRAVIEKKVKQRTVGVDRALGRLKEHPVVLCAEPTFLLAARGSGEKGDDKFPGSFNLGGDPARPGTHRSSARPAKPSALTLLYQRLNQPAGSAGVYGVPYPAISGLQFYLESRMEEQHPRVPASTEEAAKLLAAEIRKHAACKNHQKILLAGYSQGAVVVREAVHMLPPDIRARISGIALFGDPQGLAIADSGPRKGKVRQIGAPLPPELLKLTDSLCGSGDPVCDGTMPAAKRRGGGVLCGVVSAAENCLHYSYQGGATDLAAVFLSQLPKR